MGGLTYQRTYDSSIQDWRDSLTGAIDMDGTTYAVTLMGAAEEFTGSAGVFTSSEGGGTLTFNSTSNTYTTASGAVALYDKDLASEQPTQANEGRIVSLTLPSGEVTTFTYTELRTPAWPATPTFLAHRLQSVTNNLGYQVALGAGNPLVRPQTRYTYTQMYGSYRQSCGGGVTQAPSAAYRLTEASACASNAFCDGGADETVTTIAYDTPDAFNNLMVSAVSSGGRQRIAYCDVGGDLRHDWQRADRGRTPGG